MKLSTSQRVEVTSSFAVACDSLLDEVEHVCGRPDRLWVLGYLLSLRNKEERRTIVGYAEQASAERAKKKRKKG